VGGRHGSHTTSEPVDFPRPAQTGLALALLEVLGLLTRANLRVDAAPSAGAGDLARPHAPRAGRDGRWRPAQAAVRPTRRMTARGLALLAVAVAVLLAVGCGGSEDEASVPSQLTIAFSPTGEAVDVQELELRCDPPTGTVPDPGAACAALAAIAEPFAPVPPATACTEIYGGPEVMVVRGTWSGEEVDARLTRVDGCEIERYDRVAGALGVGVIPG
jgi:hypothetical protein